MRSSKKDRQGPGILPAVRAGRRGPIADGAALCAVQAFCRQAKPWRRRNLFPPSMSHPYGNPARQAAPGPAPSPHRGQRGVLTSKHRNGRPLRAARFAYPVRGYFRPPGAVGRGILDAPFDFRDPPGGAGLPGRGTAFDVKSGGKTTRACGPWTRSPWRRWAVSGLQRPTVHRRPLYRHLRYRRCRAPGGTHRDYPASLVSSCAVPTWPAGPPSVPCL